MLSGLGLHARNTPHRPQLRDKVGSRGHNIESNKTYKNNTTPAHLERRCPAPWPESRPDHSDPAKRPPVFV